MPPDLDSKYEAFAITFRAEVEGVTVPREDIESLKPFRTEAHQTFHRVGDRLYTRNLVSEDAQWFEGGYTVTWTRDSAGKGTLVVTKGDDRYFPDDLWMFEPLPGPCLPFATGLSRVKWSDPPHGTFVTFKVSGKFNESGYPEHLSIVPGPGYEHEYRFSDFRDVSGLEVPFRTSLNTKARIWKKATFITEDLKFLRESDRLPPYPWSETVKVSDNRNGSLLSVQAAALPKYNGGKAPEDLAQLLAALDRIRPAVVRKMNELEGMGQAQREAKAWFAPTAAVVVLVPILLLVFAYFRVIRQGAAK